MVKVFGYKNQGLHENFLIIYVYYMLLSIVKIKIGL